VLLLDASVWIAAVDKDDRFHSAARTLALTPAQPLGTLDLTIYEVANVVGVVKGQGDLAARICRAIIKRSDGRVARIDAVLAEQAVKLADDNKLTAYDAAYVAAARKHSWTLVSADVKDLVKPGLALAPDDPQLSVGARPSATDR
jgi:predicted nucleic acid-binding protein